MAANSAQARAVTDALLRLDHPTAEAVWAEVRKTLPRVGLATVYRNLDRLVADGEAQAHAVGGQKRYDPNLDDHVHVHDPRTGRLVDVPMTDALRAALDDATAGLVEHVDEIVVEVRGTLREPA